MSDPVYTILLLEEDAAISRQVQQLLLRHNYHVYTAQTCATALPLCSSLQPALILCDEQLHNGDSYQFLIALRSNPAMKHIPFIFINGKNTREHIRFGMNLGADDYLFSPFNGKELLMSVKARISRFDIFRNTRDPVQHTAHTHLLVPPDIADKLSKTELRIYRMIAVGMSTREISQEMNISTKTVENHRYNISKKLNISGHHALVQYVIRNKYVER